MTTTLPPYKDMAPISDEIAVRALREYAQEVETAKAELDGQEALFAESEAEAREALDETGTPAEIASAAKLRVVEAES
jgi:hypothetical protein